MQEVDERTARHMNQISLRIDYQQFCIKWTLNCFFRGNHDLTPYNLWQKLRYRFSHLPSRLFRPF
jgi:hypothetical protein